MESFFIRKRKTENRRTACIYDDSKVTIPFQLIKQIPSNRDSEQINFSTFVFAGTTTPRFVTVTNPSFFTN